MDLDFKLRIGLWSHNYEKVPFNIQSNIDKCHDKLHQIMKTVASQMPGWKYLNRCEASISTDNEEKQIRQIMEGKPNAFIEFRSHTKVKVSIDEWKQFSKLMEDEINDIILARCDMFLISDISSE